MTSAQDIMDGLREDVQEEFEREITQHKREIAQHKREIAQHKREIAQYKREIAQYKQAIAEIEQKREKLAKIEQQWQDELSEMAQRFQQQVEAIE